ncbi:hypothetical protein DPX16_0206 [Anabarilius grahami]|uniref:Uncharacterized protein n=1 Tax=Anabarilius grahami TaxID=495550 RepID=A0A3N0Y6D2_ANAGA|nr:hypothetical protein DPX16_0206 [Anabarilius grahami]
MCYNTEGDIDTGMQITQAGDRLELRRHRGTHTRRGTTKETWEHAGDKSLFGVPCVFPVFLVSPTCDWSYSCLRVPV